MGGVCSCCNQDKNSEVNVVVQPTAFATFINEDILLSYIYTDSDNEPLPILSLPPLSDPTSFRSQETPKALFQPFPLTNSNCNI